ncbi:FAD binding domain-containing protein [Cetobacterium sp. SF1]|uniref:FAD binding domain-containing protein n=1 Tax=unclassified Cetobacterium TaxID=2630983 RepID=UPI003CE8C093
MFTFTNYYLPNSLDEAHEELMKNKKNIILGGTSYLRMSDVNYNTAIDLSNLGLNYIKEDSEYIYIGAMATFRDVETNPLLKKYFNGIIPKSLEFILGVQFRNNVTVGGSVFSKYGFSDFIPTLLALETQVTLYKNKTMSLEKFLETPMNLRDILVEIKIKKNNSLGIYRSVRKSKTDYPIVNLAIVKNNENDFKIAIGSRPGKAILFKELMNFLKEKKSLDKNILQELLKTVSFDDNMRGSKEYRELLVLNLLYSILKEDFQCC